MKNGFSALEGNHRAHPLQFLYFRDEAQRGTSLFTGKSRTGSFSTGSGSTFPSHAHFSKSNQNLLVKNIVSSLVRSKFSFHKAGKIRVDYRVVT